MADKEAKSLKDLLAGEYALALSGGGIRSATISLGIAQALAKAERLRGLTTISTVSGGGYFGAFLKSLYLPLDARGSDGRIVAEVDMERPERVLKDRNSAEIDWLRQHSRYLAPNGSGDYWSALAMMARNWLGLLYMFLVAAAGAALLALWAEHGAARWLSERVWVGYAAVAPNVGGWTLSPLSWFAAGALVITMLLGIAYWYTGTMPIARRKARKMFDVTKLNIRGALALTAMLAATGGAVALVRWALRIEGVDGPVAKALLTVIGGAVVAAIVAAGALATGILIRARLFGKPVNLTAALRRRLTSWAGFMLRAAMLFAALAAIDTLAIAFHDVLRTDRAWQWLTGVGTSGLTATGIAVIAHRAANALGDSGNRLVKWLRANWRLPALILGAVLWGGAAMLADTAMHALFWRGDAWTDGSFDAPVARVGTVAVAAVILLALVSPGFVNLSSLHHFYASRLTRAYLGGSNAARLMMRQDGDTGGTSPLTIRAKRRSASYSETHDKDGVAAKPYFLSGGPEHIVNIALNETRDPDTGLPERDRQAIAFSLGRDGIWSGNTLRAWDEATLEDSEPLPIGQWIAISGAAVSTAMGRLTSAGGALLLTFANARLGYWWRQDRRRLGTPYGALLSEMRAYYRRDSARVYLTDGGHFDNSGVYGILMRRQRGMPAPGCIIVADNGADPGFAFGDLEQLTRRARLDLGWQIDVLGAGEAARRAGVAADLFLNADAGRAWRARATDAEGGAIALWLTATQPEWPDHPTIDILWLKPRATADLPADVAGYAKANPTFPHQSTGDQFFDEAQFESYRVLGECVMTKLLSRAAAPAAPAHATATTTAPRPRAARSRGRSTPPSPARA